MQYKEASASQWAHSTCCLMFPNLSLCQIFFKKKISWDKIASLKFWDSKIRASETQNTGLNLERKDSLIVASYRKNVKEIFIKQKNITRYWILDEFSGCTEFKNKTVTMIMGQEVTCRSNTDKPETCSVSQAIPGLEMNEEMQGRLKVWIRNWKRLPWLFALFAFPEKFIRQQ